MRKLIRIFAILMVVALAVSSLASCGNEGEDVIAVYDGECYIYENDADFSDFYNLNRYFYAYESGDEAKSKSEYNTILDNAVKQTVMLRMLEDEKNPLGYEIDMNVVYADAENDKATFEEFYHGGFEKFCSDWGLSSNVFVLLNKYEAIKEKEKEKIEVTVSESEIRKYYEKNPDKYFKIPHYDVNTLFLQVLEPSSEENMHSVHDDALIYMNLLNSGRTWDNVKSIMSKTYNSGNGMIFSEQLSRINHVSMQYFFEVENLEAALAERNAEFYSKYGMTFNEMFPCCFEDYVIEHELKPETKEYNFALETYMSYATDVYNIEFNYAISNFWEKGKTYEKPIYHYVYNSYVLLTFTGIEEENITIEYEDAKEGIIEILTESKKEKAVENRISENMDDLKVQINYK